MLRLLLAEDEYIEREAMKHIIHKKFPGQFEIKEATNGIEALEMITSFVPDFLFLDIKMPGMSGVEVARKAATRSEERRVGKECKSCCRFRW